MTKSGGTEYEKRVFDYFSKLLEKGSLPFANKSYSEIFMHKSYPTTTSRKIICDISIETYNPFNKDNWSSLIIVECKCYSKRRSLSIPLLELCFDTVSLSVSSLRHTQRNSISFNPTMSLYITISFILLHSLTTSKSGIRPFCHLS